MWHSWRTVALITSLVLLTLAVLPLLASAWNIPGHMLSGIIAYQVLQQENPHVIERVKAVLEKHPWYANQRQARLQDVPVADHGLVLFMQAAWWADIRFRDKQHHAGASHCPPAFVNKIKTQPVKAMDREVHFRS
jgi:hypothetical protein